MEEKAPETLYHYCSVETLRLIAENKTLRLGEIAKSNDSMECQWLERNVLPELISDIVCEKYLSSIIPPIPKDELRSKALYGFSRYYGHEIDLITPRLLFAMCFSQNGDLLSQWRGYGSDGYGLAIGFKKDLFEKINIQNEFLHFKRVIYSKSEQRVRYQDEVAAYVDFVSSRRNIESSAKAIQIISNTRLDSAIMKNPAFIEEEEWRLFILYHEIKHFSDLLGDYEFEKLSTLLSELKCCTRSDKLLFYHDLFLQKVPHEGELLPWISRIIRGPKCRLNERDILLLLERYGWDTSNIEISRSSATYI